LVLLLSGLLAHHLFSILVLIFLAFTFFALAVLLAVFRNFNAISDHNHEDRGTTRSRQATNLGLRRLLIFFCGKREQKET
jgi:hypothetical protein